MRRYELTDSDWEIIGKYFPDKKLGTPGRPPNPQRPKVNGIVWLTRSGAAWRDLPERYGPWRTIYDFFNIHKELGTWELIFKELNIDADMETLQLDSTSVKVHQHAAGVKKGRKNRL